MCCVWASSHSRRLATPLGCPFATSGAAARRARGHAPGGPRPDGCRAGRGQPPRIPARLPSYSMLALKPVPHPRTSARSRPRFMYPRLVGSCAEPFVAYSLTDRRMMRCAGPRWGPSQERRVSHALKARCDLMVKEVLQIRENVAAMNAKVTIPKAHLPAFQYETGSGPRRTIVPRPSIPRKMIEDRDATTSLTHPCLPTGQTRRSAHSTVTRICAARTVGCTLAIPAG